MTGPPSKKRCSVTRGASVRPRSRPGGGPLRHAIGSIERAWTSARPGTATLRECSRPSRRPGAARLHLERVPPRSPLGKAISRVLAGAATKGDAERWSTALGTFLSWVNARDLMATELWPGDVAVFRRDYLASGRRSPGEYVRVARRLVHELSQRYGSPGLPGGP
jgi:hypothetical protein